MNRNSKPDPQRAWNSLAGMSPSQKHTNAAARLLDEANRLGALSDPQVLSLMETLVARPWDVQLLSFINEALQFYRTQQVLFPDVLRPYPGPDDTELGIGDIYLGEIRETGLDWWMGAADLAHILLTGSTGSGKTYFFYGLLEQLARVLPVVMVTVKPGDARLLADPPVFGQAFRVEELKLSLFTPPLGVDEEAFTRDTLELLCRIFGLQLSRSVLHEASDDLRRIYADYSRQKGKKLAYTPRVLHSMLQRKRSKYVDSIRSALDTFCRATGGIFEWSRGHSIDRLFCHHSTLLILNAIVDDRVARFFVDWLMLWIARHLETNGPNDGSPQLVLVLDDGHRFLSKTNEKDSLMPLSHQYLTIRQAGVRLVVVSQYPSDLATPVLSQSGLIIQVGDLVHSRDCRIMADAFGMDSGEWQRLQKVKKAEFVARESLGRYDRPFAGYVSQFPGPSFPFSDADRAALMRPVLSAFPVAPAVSLAEAEQALGVSARGSVPARVPGHVSPDARRLAEDILAYPWDFLRVRYRRLDIRGGKAQRAKEELLDSGWVREHKIARRGGKPTLLEPLHSLATTLGQALPVTGKGGFLHAFAQHIVAARLKALNYTDIRKERFFGSKAVDVTATDLSGLDVGFEVAVSLSNLVDNIEKDYLCHPSFALITTVCMSASEVRQAKRMVAAAPALKLLSSKVRVEALAKWLV